MHAVELLHKILKEKLPSIHKSRLLCLMEAVEALVTSGKLTLTSIARNISNKAKVISNIKKIDRLLKSYKIHNERFSIYSAMTDYIVSENSNLWIHIDWSCISPTTNIYVLRASIAFKGRAVVLYEEAHPKKHENNHSAHTNFLRQLKALLPLSVKPVIITDAGFRGPWFQAVRSLGWDFVGRMRNKNAICFEGSTEWLISQSLYEQATEIPTYLGHAIMTVDSKIPVDIFIYKERNKNRHKLNKNKKKSRSHNSIKYSKSSKEPWLLVTSLNGKQKSAKQVISTYKTRMQIEETFRDTKSTRYGFSLHESLSRSVDRVNVLLLIGALASFTCWLVGLQMKYEGRASEFQSQSSKNTSVLSICFLGREAFKKKVKTTKKQFLFFLRNLSMLIRHGQRMTI